MGVSVGQAAAAGEAEIEVRCAVFLVAAEDGADPDQLGIVVIDAPVPGQWGAEGFGTVGVGDDQLGSGVELVIGGAVAAGEEVSELLVQGHGGFRLLVDDLGDRLAGEVGDAFRGELLENLLALFG